MTEDDQELPALTRRQRTDRSRCGATTPACPTCFEVLEAVAPDEGCCPKCESIFELGAMSPCPNLATMRVEDETGEDWVCRSHAALWFRLGREL